MYVDGDGSENENSVLKIKSVCIIINFAQINICFRMDFDKERIGYVDAAKGLGMLLIMLGHITKYDNPVDLWMSSFKVVIFYIMSGFLMSYTGSVKKRSFGVFMKKHSQVLPYLM